MSLNLAASPFVNQRPVRRTGYILWLVGLLLALANVYLYWSYLSGQGATQTGLQEVSAQLEQESAQLRAAQEELAGFEPRELNRKIEFVNLRIVQRTFSWSRLFDVVAETLPGDVRLASLSPKFGEGDRRERRGRRGANLQFGEVLLEIRGEAKTSEALLEFVDRLFAHDAFKNADLRQEQYQEGTGRIFFSVSTMYLADAAGNGQEGSE